MLAIILSSPGLVYPMDYKEAVAIEESGNTEDALQAYREVLSADDENFCLATLRLYPLLNNIAEKKLVLGNAVGKCGVATQRHAVLRALAKLEEITGNLSVAQSLFLQASFALPDEKDFGSLFSSALLLFDLGEYRGAEAQAKAIIETGRLDSLKVAAQILLSRVYFATEREQKSVGIVFSLMDGQHDVPPSGLLWIVEMATLLGDDDLRQAAGRILELEYPDSPELALLRREVDYLPSPSVFLGLRLDPIDEVSTGDVEHVAEEMPPVFSVQTGSYSVRENAEYAVNDLREAGFAVAIREVIVREALYYRVVLVGVTEDNVDTAILDLKEKGFEGFRIAE
jgi:tetratricopeptide (TPR) repeat protein